MREEKQSEERCKNLDYLKNKDHSSGRSCANLSPESLSFVGVSCDIHDRLKRAHSHGVQRAIMNHVVRQSTIAKSVIVPFAATIDGTFEAKPARENGREIIAPTSNERRSSPSSETGIKREITKIT